MTKDKIFISHSSKDIIFIKQFVEKILILGLDIPAERIFCSSMEGQGIRSGQYIPDTLKVEINSSSLALLFISKNYKTSEVCLNEVGAAWATLRKETIIPLLMPDIDFSEIGFLDVNRLGLKIYQKEGILKLIQDCKENLNPSFNLEKLHKKIEEYLTEIELISKTSKQANLNTENEKVDEWTDCFINCQVSQRC